MIQPPDADGMVQLTSNVRVPHRRAVEWMQGIRPLDDMDPSFFFDQMVKVGLLTREQALKLHERHLQLTRQEAAAADGLVCKTCEGRPPVGFVCRSCGAES